MRTNNIIPILLATAIHLIPAGFFLLKSPAVEVHTKIAPESIGISDFSLEQKKQIKNSIKSVGLSPSSSQSTTASVAGEGKNSIQAAAPVNGSAGVGELNFVKYSEPLYPPVARANGMEGTVKIKVYYDKAGDVGSVDIISSSGYKMLDESVKKSAALWKLPSGSEGNFEKTFSFKLKN
ncbi:MAG: energy transducer TonB [Bacteriovorax sp.]|jgi:protein TonB